MICRYLALAAAFAFLGTSGADAAYTFTFKTMTNPALSPKAGWLFTAGDFFPDPFTDIAGFHPSNNTVWPFKNRKSDFHALNHGSDFPTDQLLAGDFNRDGRGDLINESYGGGTNHYRFLIVNGDGSVTNNGVERREAAPNRSYVTGDFTGDGIDDLVGYESSTGKLVVIPGNGSQVDLTKIATWATLSPETGWQFVSGDFNFDGRLDLMGYSSISGSLYLLRNTATAFDGLTVWGTIPAGPKTGWQFVSGRFHNRSTNIDVLGYRSTDGTIWVGQNTNTGLTFTKWYTFPTTGARTILSGYFSPTTDHTLPESIAVYTPATGVVSVGHVTGP